MKGAYAYGMSEEVGRRGRRNNLLRNFWGGVILSGLPKKAKKKGIKRRGKR
jgi:hypothetical protein